MSENVVKKERINIEISAPKKKEKKNNRDTGPLTYNLAYLVDQLYPSHKKKEEQK